MLATFKNERWFLYAYRAARPLYRDDEVHGWPHVLRVLANAYSIVALENASVSDKVLVASVLFHDAGRAFERSTGVHHAIISAKIAALHLSRAPSLFSRDEVRLIANAVLAHSYSLGVEPLSVEARILSDADKLDALGAVGVYRAIAEGERLARGIGGTIEHLAEKVVGLPERMYTKAARRLAERRVAMVVEYLKRLRAEYEEYRAVERQI